MTDYLTVKTLLERDLYQQETALSVTDDALHSRVWLHEAPTNRVCVFFHGFTSGPHQFDPLGKKLFAAGNNVLVPLMPGHGRAGDWGRDNPPPLPTEPKEYLQFAVQWLNLAHKLGQRVAVGGLSGGGTLAAWLALEKAMEVDRAILFAPYFGASMGVINLFTQHSNMYYSWNDDGSKSLPGYPGFTMPALRVFLEIGQYCLSRVKRSPVAPTFIISSESDKAVSNRDHQHFFEAARKHQPMSWHLCFDKVLDIPHTMMKKAEGNQYEHLLNSIACAFIESDVTWSEIEEIAYRMTKGRTFPAVIEDLGWQDKVSRDLPTLITMVDKWSITLNREFESQRGTRLRDRRRQDW